MTHMCVNSTARGAFNLGYAPTVVAAATATRSLPGVGGAVSAAALQAASLAALLVAAGTPGKRMALPHARMLLHQPLGSFSGQAADVDIQAREIVRMQRRLHEEEPGLFDAPQCPQGIVPACLARVLELGAEVGTGGPRPRAGGGHEVFGDQEEVLILERGLG